MQAAAADLHSSLSFSVPSQKRVPVACADWLRCSGRRRAELKCSVVGWMLGESLQGPFPAGLFYTTGAAAALGLGCALTVKSNWSTVPAARKAARCAHLQMPG